MASTHPVQPRSRRKDDTALALAFIAPALVGFLVFLLWPTLRGIYLSFTSFNLLTPPRFVGLDNYVRMVNDPIFWNAAKVTLEYVVINIGIQTVVALLIAVLMDRLTKSTFVRGVVLAPYLLPLDDFEATKGIDSADYQAGLGDVWVGQDGKRYGAPKDWDTVGYFYDKKLTDAGGISPEQLATMTWNPEDGGSFEKIIAHLSVDTNGRRGDEPGFDANNVKVFGLASDGSGGGNFGQTQWAPYTMSQDGWQPTDTNPWGTHFRFDDPNYQKAVAWYYGLAEKGYMPRYSTFGPGTGSYAQFAAGRAALAMNGSWMISSFSSLKNVELRMAPTPVGPSGKRATPFNGLADSITKYTHNPEGSAKWVAYMASAKCQDVIGAAGVVFPARASGTEISLATRKKAGLDVSAFTVQVDEKTTVLQPVVQNAADLTALTEPQFDALYIGSAPVSELTTMNNQINKLFEITAK